MCRSCGEQHPGRKCRAWDTFCLKCNRKGHYARVCETGNNSQKLTAIFISSIIGNCNKKDSLPRLEVLIGEGYAPIPMKLLVIANTGAEATVIGDVYRESLGIKPHMLYSPKMKLRHVAGGEIPSIIGSCWLTFQVNRECHTEEIFFVSGISEIFLSLKACKGLSLVLHNFPQQVIHKKLFDVTQEQEEADTSVGQPGDVMASINVESNAETADSEKFEIPVKPEILPYPPTDENIGKLEAWFLDTFKVVFTTDMYPLRVMSGKPQHIHLKMDAVPVAVHTPIPSPAHWRGQIKEILKDDIRLGIMEKVPIREPSEWVSRSLAVGKKDGSPRIVVDFMELNKNFLRESHPSKYPFDIISSIPLNTYKTVADAYQGYHQVHLDKESSMLTTFMNEDMGRLRFLRTPQGLSSADDACCSRYGEVLHSIPRKARVVDDTLLYDFDIKQSFYHTFDFLLAKT